MLVTIPAKIKLVDQFERKDKKTDQLIKLFRYYIQSDEKEVITLYSQIDFSEFVDTPVNLEIRISEFQGRHRLSLLSVRPADLRYVKPKKAETSPNA